MNKADAQQSAGLTIKPAIIEDKVDPGQTFSSFLQVTNNTSKTEDYYTLKKDITSISGEGQPTFAEEGVATGYELSSWINIEKGPFTIESGQTREIPFTINVPLTASPGGHFGGLFISLTAEKPKETGVGVGYQVGTIISLRISGKTVEEAQMRSFYTDKSIYSKPVVTFITKVENLGNVVIKPRGPLEITDWFGKKVADLRINDTAASILPESQRQFEAVWEGDGFVFGRYDAVLSLAYGDKPYVKTITRAVSFWVLPLNIVLPVAGTIIGIILIFWVGFKLMLRSKMRAIEEATQKYSKNKSVATSKVNLRKQKKSSSKIAFLALTLVVFTLLFLAYIFLFA